LAPPKKAQERAERLQRTVAMVAIRNVGFKRALQAVGFVVTWGLFSEHVGHEATSTELIEASKGERSRAAIFRDQAAFRAAFPGHDTPAVIWRAYRAARPGRVTASTATVDLFGLAMPKAA